MLFLLRNINLGEANFQNYSLRTRHHVHTSNISNNYGFIILGSFFYSNFSHKLNGCLQSERFLFLLNNMLPSTLPLPYPVHTQCHSIPPPWPGSCDVYEGLPRPPPGCATKRRVRLAPIESATVAH